MAAPGKIELRQTLTRETIDRVEAFRAAYRPTYIRSRVIEELILAGIQHIEDLTPSREASHV